MASLCPLFKNKQITDNFLNASPEVSWQSKQKLEMKRNKDVVYFVPTINISHNKT